jgi:hypothetical protein
VMPGTSKRQTATTERDAYRRCTRVHQPKLCVLRHKKALRLVPFCQQKWQM